LYRIDTANTFEFVADVLPGNRSESEPSDFIAYNGDLYFTARSDPDARDLFVLASIADTTSSIVPMNGVFSQRPVCRLTLSPNLLGLVRVNRTRSSGSGGSPGAKLSLRPAMRWSP
jgi:hypothetical protein